MCSPAGPPYSPVYGLWLGVSGPEGQMGLESPRQPGVTRDPSSSAIFELSALHRVEEARLETTETAALLPGTDLGRMEGGHGGECSLEALARSAAPNGQCTPLPELEGVSSGDLGEAERVAPSPSSWSRGSSRAARKLRVTTEPAPPREGRKLKLLPTRPLLHHSPPGAWARAAPKPDSEPGKAGRKSLRLAALVTACPAPLRHRREPARSSPRGGAGDRGPGRRPLR